MLPRPRAGRRFVAKIRHKGVEVHLGLYESAGLAAFAFNVASEAVGRGSRPPNEVPRAEQPDAESVRRITANVRRRLGLDPPVRPLDEVPPDPEALLILFEVTIVGFWRDQAAQSDAGPGLEAAARRLAESARLVFWNPRAGHPSPAEAITRLVSRRIDQAFRRSDLTRAILDDDGDDESAGRPMARPPRRLPGLARLPRGGPIPLSRALRGDLGGLVARRGAPLGGRPGDRPAFQHGPGPRGLPGPVQVDPPRCRGEP